MRANRLLGLLSLVMFFVGRTAAAQTDTTQRLRRYVHDVTIGTIEGLAWAGVDQWRNDPTQWGKGWDGYGKRAASDIGEFLVQETVTASLAAAMHRPIEYIPCRCRETGDRIAWATSLALLDPMPDGSRAIAVPRIVGAYAGSFAQAAWRPDTKNRPRVALVNGTTSLALGALYNLFWEWRAGHRGRV
jgi:hypothetical protein